MMPSMDLDAVARTAADQDASLRSRVDALITVVERVSVYGVPIPEAIVVGLDDLDLVDAAHASGRANAVCAALHQLGPRHDLESTRKRVVRRLVARGAQGISLAGLAIEIGDVLPGSKLAAREFEELIAPRLSIAGDHVVRAFLSWLAEQPDTAVAAVLRQLAGTTSLAELVAHADPVHHARIATMVRSILGA
jgi:hypothetical protein